MKLEIGQFVHKVGSSVLVSKDKQISMKDLIKKKNENFLKMRVTLLLDIDPSLNIFSEEINIA